MKQFYTLALLLLAGAASAQTPMRQSLANKTAPMSKYAPSVVELNTGEFNAQGAMPEKVPSLVHNPREYTQWVVGASYYDLQSNGSVQNRISMAGSLKATAWTQSFQQASYTDRGTGYNATNVETWPDIPTERLEAIRTGWPSLLHLANGKEVIINHDFPTSLYMLSRDNFGDAWTGETIISSAPEGILWARAVAGGADGNTIHMIALTAPAANQTLDPTVTFEGLDGAIVYWRSQDGGETWDISDEVLDGMGSDFFVGNRADSYAIHARGEKVAFAVFNSFADSYMMVSEDNGANWTKEIFVDFPVDLYTGDDEIIDLDGDFIADTLYNTDNGGAIFIDSDMNTHVLWGNMRYMDDELGDDAWSFFPYTDGLAYWREGWGADNYVDIAFAEDTDGDQILSFLETYALYYMSLTSTPQMGEDADGNLYVSYVGMMESHGTSTQNYRHMYIIKSEDGGETWSVPVNVTPDEDFDGYEVSFPSMSPVVDDYVHILYQRDFEPGLSVLGDFDPADLNDMVYFRITTDLEVEEVIGVEEQVGNTLSLFPNPANNQITISSENLIGGIRIADISGRIVKTMFNVSNGSTTIDITDLPAGLYVVQSESGDALRFVKQ